MIRYTHRSSHPLTGVDGSVPDDGGLSGSIGTVQVNTADGAALERLSDVEQLRVGGEGGLQVREE